MKIPSFQDVLLARRQIRPYLLRTPTHTHTAVNDLVGAEVFIKHENYQPVGAFKVRGGIIRQAMVWMIERAHTLAEAAGAAPLAAAYRMRDELRGKKIGIICSGGNTSLEHLKYALGVS